MSADRANLTRLQGLALYFAAAFMLIVDMAPRSIFNMIAAAALFVGGCIFLASAAIIAEVRRRG